MKFYFPLLLLIILYNACTYSPDDIYYVNLTKPAAPEMRTIDLSLDQSTIYLYGGYDIQFNFSAGNNSILKVSVLIDGEEKYVRSNYQDQFTLLASDISEGIHKLSFSVITNANSGSIADLLGVEGFNFISSEWTLICIHNDRRASFVEKSVDNGYLKISWENYDKIDFKSYHITKKTWEYGEIVNEYHTTEPFIVDKAYVGEIAYYDIYIENLYNADYEFHWGIIFIRNSLPAIDFKYAGDDGYNAFWENNEYFKAIKSYKLIDVTDPFNPVLLGQTSPQEYNVVLMQNVVFAEEKSLQLLSIPQYPDKPVSNDSLYYHTSNYSGLIGSASFKYSQMKIINQNDLLLLDDGIIYKYSTLSNKKIDLLNYDWTHCGTGYINFSISGKGQYFTTKESCENKLVLMNSYNMQNYQAYPVSQVITEGMNFYSLPVSDNGIVIAKDYSRINIYDVFNNKVIDYIDSNAAIYSEGISSNGTYFYIKTSQLSFYKISNGIINTVWQSTPYTYNYVYLSSVFDPDNLDNVILYDGQTLYHKSASDFSTLKSFQLKEESILNFDFTCRRLLAYSDNQLSVYEIDTGELVAQIKANVNASLTQHQCRLHNNVIYCKDGIRVNLPEE